MVDKHNKKNNEINQIIKKEENSIDKKKSNFIKIISLNMNKYDFLLTSKNVNFFRLGPIIIKLILDYMENILLFKYMNSSGNKKIIAMTSDTYKKYYKIINKNYYELIIIEEAEKVSESHILSLLTKIASHIILFGDINLLELNENKRNGQQYDNMQTIPLLKRLMNNNIPVTILEYQRRMKPLFAEFIRIMNSDNINDIYKNHPDVNNKKIKGIEKDMFIIQHNKLESNNNSGITNSFEVKYCLKLYQYLINQGYNNKPITILTFNQSQVNLFREEIEKFY